MKTLPPFLQKYLSEEKYTVAAQSLMSKHKLRMDQGGILERELLLLLMGIENPTEFAQALTDEAKIDPEVMHDLIKDINEQVFVPLRKQEEEMTKKAKLPQPQASIARPAVPAMPAAHPKVVVFDRPEAPKLVAKPVPAHIAPLPPKTVMPAAAGSLHDAVRAALASKPSDAKLMLEDHEEPHLDVPMAAAKAPAMPNRSESASPAAPVAQAQPVVSAPKPLAPPPVAPAHLVPGQAAPAPKPPTSSAPATPVAPRPAESPATPGTPPVAKTPPPPATSYSADPYREPIDEK